VAPDQAGFAPAVVLSKLLASIYVVLLLMVVIPAVLVCVQTRLVWGAWPHYPGFLIGLGLVSLSRVLRGLTIMLGTMFTGGDRYRVWRSDFSSPD
jgi:hypothetical protein